MNELNSCSLCGGEDELMYFYYGTSYYWIECSKCNKEFMNNGLLMHGIMGKCYPMWRKL